MIVAGAKIDNPTVLAPLAGWTDSIYRRICKELGAGLVFTEMTSADGLIRNHPDSWELIEFSETERPLGIQLFGAEPVTLSLAAERVAQLRPDFIDLNFGCPAPKVVRRGGGSALLRDLNLVARIAKEVRAATNLPLTAKLRSGWDGNIAVEVSRILEDAGFAALTLHPRSQKMQFKGQADWSIIAQVKQAVRIPVIGNGDIKDAGDAKRMLDETGCDAVMIGRAARGNPWIFKEVLEFLQTGEEPNRATNLERIRMCIRHIEQEAQRYGPRRALLFMRKHISYYIKGMPQAGELRLHIFSRTTVESIIETLTEYLGTLGESVVLEQEWVV